MLANKNYTPGQVVQQFDDCETSSVNLLAHLGIVQGTGERTFEPEKTLTREEAAAILYRLCEYTGAYTYEGELPSSYRDHQEISSWAQSAVYALYAGNIMQGVGDGYFDPKEAYTIEQAVKTLSDIYDRMPGAKKNESTPAQKDTETMLNNFFDQYYALQYKDTVYVSTTQHIADSILEFPRAECVSMVAEISGGELYLAVNKSDLSSAVYQLPSTQAIFTLPYWVFQIYNEHLIVNDVKKDAFGVYDLDGGEILAPSYRLSQLGEKGYYPLSASGGGGGRSSSGSQAVTGGPYIPDKLSVRVYDERYPTYGLQLVGMPLYTDDQGKTYLPVLDFADSLSFEVTRADVETEVSFIAYGKTITYDVKNSTVTAQPGGPTLETDVIVNGGELYAAYNDFAIAVGYTATWDVEPNLLTLTYEG